MGQVGANALVEARRTGCPWRSVLPPAKPQASERMSPLREAGSSWKARLPDGLLLLLSFELAITCPSPCSFPRRDAGLARLRSCGLNASGWLRSRSLWLALAGFLRKPERIIRSSSTEPGPLHAWRCSSRPAMSGRQGSLVAAASAHGLDFRVMASEQLFATLVEGSSPTDLSASERIERALGLLEKCSCARSAIEAWLLAMPGDRKVGLPAGPSEVSGPDGA